MRRAELLAVLVVGDGLHDGLLHLLAADLLERLAVVVVEEEVLQLVLAVESLLHGDFRLRERGVHVLAVEALLVEVPEIALRLVLAVHAAHVLGVDALEVELVVLLLDGGHEDLHEAVGRDVLRDFLDRVPALLDRLDPLLADEAPGGLRLLVAHGHEVSGDLDRDRLHDPPEVEVARALLAADRVLGRDARDLREDSPLLDVLHRRVHRPAVALGRLVRAQPVTSREVDEPEPAGRLPAPDELARGAVELFGGILDVLKENVLALEVLHGDLRRVGRGEGLRDHPLPVRLDDARPLLLAELRDELAQVVLVVEVLRPLGLDVDEVALGALQGGPHPPEQRVHARVVRILHLELADLLERCALVAPHHLLAAALERHLLFEFAHVVVRIPDAALQGGLVRRGRRGERRGPQTQAGEQFHLDSLHFVVSFPFAGVALSTVFAKHQPSTSSRPS